MPAPALLLAPARVLRQAGGAHTSPSRWGLPAGHGPSLATLSRWGRGWCGACSPVLAPPQRCALQWQHALQWQLSRALKHSKHSANLSPWRSETASTSCGPTCQAPRRRVPAAAGLLLLLPRQGPLGSLVCACAGLPTRCPLYRFLMQSEIHVASSCSSRGATGQCGGGDAAGRAAVPCAPPATLPLPVLTGGTRWQCAALWPLPLRRCAGATGASSGHACLACVLQRCWSRERLAARMPLPQPPALSLSSRVLRSCRAGEGGC